MRSVSAIYAFAMLAALLSVCKALAVLFFAFTLQAVTADHLVFLWDPSEDSACFILILAAHALALLTTDLVVLEAEAVLLYASGFGTLAGQQFLFLQLGF